MIADYYSRSAVAAAQAIEGFDEQRFRDHLDGTPVGVSSPGTGQEALTLADLAVRLLARLYPQLAINVPGDPGENLRALAAAINPAIEFIDTAEIGVVIGDAPAYSESLYAGSDGWDALVSTTEPQPTGTSDNPFGAGVAACMAAAGVFRRAFLADWRDRLDESVRFSTWTGTLVADHNEGPGLPATLAGQAVLAGAGAIGNSALWALRALPTTGTVHVIDPEKIELSNLQRYVLAERADEHAVKVELATASSARLELVAHHQTLAAFLAQHGYHWPVMMLGLDSASDRVGAQASLPQHIINAWTQPGDLGISHHSRFGGAGGCVSCMYLPEGAVRNEDELVAEALGVSDRLMEIRTALHTGRPVGRPLLEAIAAAIGRPIEVLLPFETRTVRELYVEGFCGGAVIPLSDAGRLHASAPDVHVPLAHQSALAGVLLASALIRHAIDGPPDITSVTRLDVMRPIAPMTVQLLQARRDGRCLCDDPDFVAVSAGKYS